jgi:hypothetical protein
MERQYPKRLIYTLCDVAPRRLLAFGIHKNFNMHAVLRNLISVKIRVRISYLKINNLPIFLLSMIGN